MVGDVQSGIGSAERGEHAPLPLWAILNVCTTVRADGIDADDGKIFLCVFCTRRVVGARHLRVNQRHAAPVVLDAKVDDVKVDDAWSTIQGPRRDRP